MFTRLVAWIKNLIADTSETAQMTAYIARARDVYDLERRINDWEHNQSNKSNL